MKDFSIEVHGAHRYDATGAISEPIYLSATYRHPGFQQSTGYDYGRVANPTRGELESTMTMLECGARTWALASGMAAINIVFMLLNEGDHVIFSNDLYGGTVRLANEVYARYGVGATYVDTSDLAAVQAALRPSTKLIYIETPSNPMMIISDIRALADLAHDAGALLAVDNTFLSPHFQKPLTLGADLVLHSGTKYLCGHNDVIAGFLTVAEGHDALAERIQRLIVSSGPNLSALDAWLMLRSLKTLGVRVERQAATAKQIAEWLRTQKHVTHVYYPGLPDHPGYELQCRQATGFGGMVSFKVDSAARAQAILGRLKMIAFAESLGGVESLLTYPKVQTHAEMPEDLMKATGLDDKLLRLSVGLEDAEDLMEDLGQAINN